jgi:hypothetical protein
MRKSIIRNDPGFDENASDYEVFLDGKKLERCFTADEELGMAWCRKVDDSGKYVLNEEKTEFLTEIKTGKIGIRFKKE